jgi:hypothetical protein
MFVARIFADKCVKLQLYPCSPRLAPGDRGGPDSRKSLTHRAKGIPDLREKRLLG